MQLLTIEFPPRVYCGFFASVSALSNFSTRNRSNPDLLFHQTAGGAVCPSVGWFASLGDDDDRDDRDNRDADCGKAKRPSFWEKGTTAPPRLGSSYPTALPLFSFEPHGVSEHQIMLTTRPSAVAGGNRVLGALISMSRSAQPASRIPYLANESVFKKCQTLVSISTTRLRLPRSIRKSRC